VRDKDGNLVFLADSPWILKVAKEDFPEIQFYTTSDFKVDAMAHEY
jgi:peptide chain release factor 3